jgi:hypothetical protein
MTERAPPTTLLRHFDERMRAANGALAVLEAFLDLSTIGGGDRFCHGVFSSTIAYERAIPRLIGFSCLALGGVRDGPGSIHLIEGCPVW